MTDPLWAVDEAAGLSARTVRRRLSSVSGLFAYLLARGDVSTNPVPRGLATRRERQRRGQGVPLVRTPRTLPRILGPDEVDALLSAFAHPPGPGDDAGDGARWVAALRGAGPAAGESASRRTPVFIANGKGGHQRLIPASSQFFASVAAYLRTGRPAETSTDTVFVVLKGPRRGSPLSAAGLEEILAGTRRRAGLERGSCHQWRHTCLTRLREAGTAAEAEQAHAGHASLESTRIYLHLADEWLASQYRRAAGAIDAQVLFDPAVAAAVWVWARSLAAA